MSTLPPLDKNVNLAPHVVLLGAGASIAAYLDWGQKGPRLPSMQDLIEVLSLRSVIEDAGYDTTGLNFEVFYDDLSSSGKSEGLKDSDLCPIEEANLPGFPLAQVKLNPSW